MSTSLLDDFVVSVGLDSAKFTEGQKKLADNLQKFEDKINAISKVLAASDKAATKEQGAVTDAIKKTGEEAKKTGEKAGKAGDDIAQSGKKATNEFSKLKRELLAVAGIFLSIRGIKDFFVGTIGSTAELGRKAGAFGISPTTVAQWELAAERQGGSKESIDTVIRNANQAIGDIRMGRQNANIDASRLYGVDFTKAKTAQDIMFAQIEAAQRFYQKTKNEHSNDADQGEGYGRQMQSYALREMGFADDLIRLVNSGKFATEEYLSQVKKRAAQEAALAEQSIKVERAITDVKNSLVLAGEKIVIAFLPQIESFARYLNSPEVLDKIGEFVDMLSSSEMKEGFDTFLTVVKGFGTAIKWAAQLFVLFGKGLGDVLGWLHEHLPGFLGKDKKWDDSDNDSEDFKPESSKPGEKPHEALARWFRNISGLKSSNDASVAPTETAVSVANQLVKMGWTQAQAAGIVGSLQQESGSFNPNETTYDKYGREHYGIAQWDASRQADFKAWAGHDIHGTKREEQLAFVNYELTSGKEQKAGAAIRAAKTAAEAAEAHSVFYERAGAAEALNNQRQAYANGISGQLASSNARAAANVPNQVASASNPSASNSTSSINTSTAETHIANVNIYSDTNDPTGFARAFSNAVKNTQYQTGNANTGVPIS